jgi:hypothetical protein
MLDFIDVTKITGRLIKIFRANTAHYMYPTTYFVSSSPPKGEKYIIQNKNSVIVTSV